MLASLLVCSDRPAELADPLFDHCLVATYADRITRQVAEQFAGRLLSIDRNAGDPLDMASVVDFTPGAYKLAAGVDRLFQFMGQGRPYVTAYVDHRDWAELKAAVGSRLPRYWVITGRGVLTPSGFYPSAVQFTGPAGIGSRVGVSIVYDTGLSAMSCPHERAAQGTSPAVLDGQLAAVDHVVHMWERR